jgi:hypothetical protein
MGMLALFALSSFPWAFPQITRFVTGENPSSERFQREYGRLLERVGARLGAPAALARTGARR